MMPHGRFKDLLLTSAMMIAASFSTGCIKDSIQKDDRHLVTRLDRTVTAVPLLNRRLYVYKTDFLPSGDIIKRWYWDAAWEIKDSHGNVIRRMYSPDWSPEGTNAGPHITVIHDPQRGTIYEAFFVQKTEAVFDLPMALHFFATRESQTPLFTLPFTDSTTKECLAGRTSRGSIKTPGIDKTLIESAEWVGIGWQSTAYERC